MRQGQSTAASIPALWWTIFLLGCALSVLMALRSQVDGDQSLMLDLGWRLLTNGEWLQYGMPTSAGGRSPGGLTGLLVAFPLYLWPDHRALALLTAVVHAVAFLLLVRAVRPALTPQAIWLLLLFVWLNPWRMYYSAHIWNSNFMLVAAILHMMSAQQMSLHKNAVATCLHVVLIAVAMQIHTSAAVLGILSLLLFWRKIIRVHWGGFAVGVVLGAALYVPWLLAILNDPELAPGEKGFFLRGLLLVFPFLRGVLYTVKMATLSMPSRTMDFDFASTFGAASNAWLLPVGMVLTALAHVTVLPSLWAHYRFARRFVRQDWPRFRTPSRWQPQDVSHPRRWLRSYMALTLLAALISFAISPTTAMFWQAFILLPVVALVLIMTIEALQRSRWAHWTRRGLQGWSVAAILIMIFQALAAPKYRCGGDELGPLNQMHRALNVSAGCQ